MKFIFSLLIFTFLAACTPSLTIPSNPKEGLLAEAIKYLADDKLKGRETGTQGEKMAADYIASVYKDMGLEPYGDIRKGKQTFMQVFEAVNTADPHGHGSDMPSDEALIQGRNVIAHIDNGAENTVVFGAHYDHLGMGGFGSLYDGEAEIHNGADDNASGVAVMLYLAKMLKEKNIKHSNFLFIAFSGEEKGLWGSNYFVKNPTCDLSKINYMINFDMVGRLKNNRLAINGTGTSPDWRVLDKANKGFQLIKSESGIGPSDHTSFYLEGIPAIHFFTGQHDDYHKPSDDIEKVNYTGCYQIGNYVYRIVQEIKGEKIGFNKTRDEQEGRMSFKVTLGVIPDYLFQGNGMQIDGVRAGKTADSAGIRKGDIVVKMGDLVVNDMNAYMKALGTFEPGQTIKVVVVREGKTLEKEVTFQ